MGTTIHEPAGCVMVARLGSSFPSHLHPAIDPKLVLARLYDERPRRYPRWPTETECFPQSSQSRIFQVRVFAPEGKLAGVDPAARTQTSPRPSQRPGGQKIHSYLEK
jgi:hypothetical protein